ncbi:MAG TPA: hypothetical protein VI789_07030 [Dehalococcoidia bacterium]|nr:hypothetical protein [Dehalococcoidia bacterium]
MKRWVAVVAAGVLVILAVSVVMLTRDQDLSESQRTWCTANSGIVLATFALNGHAAPPSFNWVLAVSDYLSGTDEHRPGGQLSDSEKDWITQACQEAFAASN